MKIKINNKDDTKPRFYKAFINRFGHVAINPQTMSVDTWEAAVSYLKLEPRKLVVIYNDDIYFFNRHGEVVNAKDHPPMWRNFTNSNKEVATENIWS